MIVYVDLEHDLLKQQPEMWQRVMARRMKHKYRFEKMTGQPCLIVRYDQVSPELLKSLRPQVRAVLISGCFTDFEHYSDESLAGLRAVYREASWPMLGLCAGFQLMMEAYGAEIGPISPPDGRRDIHDGVEYISEHEYGFMPIQVHTRHHLFADLPEPIVFQAHSWEVKSVPDGFRDLAESDSTKIQAVAHIDLPLYGVQFHPEEYDQEHRDGRRVIENFFMLAGVR